MALLSIRRFPDPVLRAVATPVERFDDDTRRLVDDMASTMFAEPGVGLAAPQVGVGLRLFVLDWALFGETGVQRARVFANPTVTFTEGDQTDMEGCLSFPGVFEEITRPRRVGIRAFDADGKPFEVVADGLPARAMLHEIDHLDGRLMIDYMSPLKRRMVKREAERGFPNAARNREAHDSPAG